MWMCLETQQQQEEEVKEEEEETFLILKLNFVRVSLRRAGRVAVPAPFSESLPVRTSGAVAVPVARR